MHLPLCITGVKYIKGIAVITNGAIQNRHPYMAPLLLTHALSLHACATPPPCTPAHAPPRHVGPMHLRHHAMSVCRSLIGLDSGTLIDLIATPDLCLHFSSTTLRFVCPSL
jgi:hypothetical protein